MPCVLLPIAVCALAARPFADRLHKPGSTALGGWLFVGIALGVTAVPVLVTIVGDLGIASSPVARVALRVAVVTDGFAWILVTALVIMGTKVAAISLPALVVGVALLVAVVLVIPRLELFRHGGAPVVTMVVAALAGAASTQLLGFHPAIGAVIAGSFFPVGFANEPSTFTVVVDVLLPAFFVSSAMAVPLQALREQLSWGGLGCVAVLAVAAFSSKLGAGLLFGTTRQWWQLAWSVNTLSSGKNTNRPKLQQALAYVREGDTLVVHSMDRLGRSLVDLRRTVDDLAARGVAVRILKVGLTFTSVGNRA